MSAKTDNNFENEENFANKLGIRLIGPKRFVEMMQLYAKTPRASLCGIGKAGLGKSATAKQEARRRGVPYMTMHIPQMCVEDFFLPTAGADSKEYYDKRIPRKFQELLEFCAKQKDLPLLERKNPMIIIEEPNRANDKNVTKALFTVIEDRMIGDTRIPDEIQIVCLMNPSEGGMMVNEFEKDPAYRRRLLFIGIRLAYAEFMLYAKNEGNFHPQVVRFLEAQTKWLYDDKANAAGKVFANPAAWETVSDLCFALDRAGRPLTGQFASDGFAGKIGTAATEAFVNYMKDSDSVISSQDVLTGYKTKSKVRDRVKKMCDEGRDGVLTDLCTEIATYLFDGTNRDPKTFGPQLALFMNDLPAERMVDFVKFKLNTASDGCEGGYDYFRTLNVYFSTQPEFQQAMKTLRDISAKADAAKSSKAPATP